MIKTFVDKTIIVKDGEQYNRSYFLEMNIFALMSFIIGLSAIFTSGYIVDFFGGALVLSSIIPIVSGVLVIVGALGLWNIRFNDTELNCSRLAHA